ncbi:aminotransferase class I/II-fold pyridoxal phosphate-dependent enzyme [Elizabethkingia argentiflava]|uniref:Aminotransferase class I/II-fold pyridoxal phosphate-dependent enzyme n=1 Tax=Elizabethkingia argenteiflava TaxID=2681556 RepID=A0A845PYB0_9FLAO|nr:aminotransferase class I/II-fold pyridoxal phosphate-dependent enzyme [Elizabethkingia argenteiflava]NAW51901.1 aminotransferase class I/II-fold pyridoxal phosphate-dependent enzyme [Elizabethkingia argenteiflava]
MKLPDHWSNDLSKRQHRGEYRSLSLSAIGIDFLSNDYLGLAQNIKFQRDLLQLLHGDSRLLTGATGSRLLSGNSLHCTQTEYFIAQKHQVESATLFPSGYKANLALFSCIAGRNHTILVDEYIHRSVHDGCRLSYAKKKKFKHNDVSHLEDLLSKTKGRVFIAVESLYSMDGDFAPLVEIVTLAEKYSAWVIVDEAHAIGVFNRGLVNEYGLQDRVLARVVTYGKAFALQGAAVLGSSTLKNYLINFASPFIYSTAMPDFQILCIEEAYQFIEQHPSLRKDLQHNIQYFRQHSVHSLSDDKSPIQVVQFPSLDHLHQAVGALKEEGIYTCAIRAPTVEVGYERLRITLHQFNSASEIDQLVSIIKNYQHEY